MSLRALIAAVLLAAACAADAAVTSLAVWQHVPVLENGRIMPMDSYARQTLLTLSGKSTFDRKPAIDWLTRVLFTPEETYGDVVFLVNNPEVIEALGIPAEGRGRYSYRQLEPVLETIMRLARSAAALEDEARSPVEKELLQLYHNVNDYKLLVDGFAFAVPRPEYNVTEANLRADLELPALPDGISYYDVQRSLAKLNELRQEARRVPAGERTAYQQQADYLFDIFRAAHRHRSSGMPAIIPAENESVTSWLGPSDIAYSGAQAESFREPLDALADAAGAFRAGRQLEFDMAARRFMALVGKQILNPDVLRNLRREVVYNRSDAFYRAELLYGLAFVFALFSVMNSRPWIRSASLALVGLALIPHTYGIVSRMIIMGRPPVTNLYATFIFVGWVCVLIGLTVEFLQRNRLGILSASISGLALLITSGRFASNGDTMGVMVAVLDSNFWLATHVVCITIGYAGCCLAGLLGHIYLLQALRRPPMHPKLVETFNATYGA
ncbi:MAG TPA: hypothetical protein VIH35_02835, partial [Kiritimatiellia bacterium]